ncbi:mannose-1-phosphate guanylyltransferase [Thermosyntropha lipolytica DSM 11003]|uniref:Mannose-1-phosphate guanylyltransferase n=1 Tax=Thermosyntropha lipolytica DSM 11003 TaxID=1123382 RepID=A0A1M5QIW3_9FIRM|nr:mannose-1-phosphate guanylyltransferase [Thermosyntropha lipolytica]SHH13750.1 mannose-1-phosphate guanylyltransferase [Thermosyntropha lipolytica DSM 11003]
MLSVILAGGKGLRLWPESRSFRPKQLCQLVDEKSMLEHTIDRLKKAGSEKIIILTNQSLVKAIEELISQHPDKNNIQIISEPESKNTAPAVGLILSYYAENIDDIIGFFPADHHILNLQKFTATIEKACLAAKAGHLTTIGIKPDRPETGFGYIEKTKLEVGQIPEVYQVNSFYEKPDFKTALSYIKSGNHMWNSGIYIGKVKTFLEEFAHNLPEIYEKIKKGPEFYINSYAEMPDISIDYGIAEKSSRLAVVISDFGWCDLGSWNALEKIHPKDEYGNIAFGSDILFLDAGNCIARQKEKTLVLFGVENLLVVETEDIVFISHRDKCQDMREITHILQKIGRYDLL